jgi:dTMP kinase
MRQGLKKGVFIVFEGIDGSGKTTQGNLLKAKAEEADIDVVFVKEPTNGQWGLKIRNIARYGRDNVTLEEELRFFIFDRKEDVEQNIQPALDRNALVIADRYFYSNIVYQSTLGLDPNLIRSLNAKFPVPDLVIILEVTPGFSQVRITDSRNDTANLGYEQLHYLTDVKKAYDKLDDANIVRLDGTEDMETIHARIWERVLPFLESAG